MKSKKQTIEVLVTGAVIKDDFCHFSYEIIQGIGQGFKHNVKGTGIIKQDMRDAFDKCNVHLAVVDDVFKHSRIEIDNIDKFHNNELAGLYRCDGFKIKGLDENETISLKGTKHVNTGGWMEIETPFVQLDQLSGYKWFNELKEAANHMRDEVELYMNGKYDMPKEDEEENPKQLKITDNQDEDAELEKARV